MGRLICTGDIHGEIIRLWNIDDSEMTKEDIFIVLGDFGVIWKDDKRTIKVLELLGEKNFTIAFVDGNHENFALISDLEKEIDWNGGRAGLLPGGIIHLLRGQIYNICNKVVGVCGGANSVDLWHRTEGISWWPAEEISEIDIEMFKLNLKEKQIEKIDLMLSHTCPASILPIVALYSVANGTDVKPHKSELMLEKINQMVEIDKWLFGHWHVDIQFDNKFECLYKRLKEV